MYVQAQPWGHQYFPFYFYPYWAVYIASAITLFFVTLEIFRSVLSAFSGLMRLGTVVFRWVALVSAVASLGSISYTHPNISLIPDFALALMRSVSILELCLLAFLCLCINALQLSFKDLAVGFGLGFGFMSANDLIYAALEPGQFIAQCTVAVCCTRRSSCSPSACGSPTARCPNACASPW